MYHWLFLLASVHGSVAACSSMRRSHWKLKSDNTYSFYMYHCGCNYPLLLEPPQSNHITDAAHMGQLYNMCSLVLGVSQTKIRTSIEHGRDRRTAISTHRTLNKNSWRNQKTHISHQFTFYSSSSETFLERFCNDFVTFCARGSIFVVRCTF